MKQRTITALTVISGTFLLALVAAIAVAQSQQENQTVPSESELPPGWTQEDMQACMVAGTPGKQHEHLQKMVGTWAARDQMWMAPDTEAMTCESTWTISDLMDGRYIKTEVRGEMPGMGPFNGLGITGYDNVAQQYVGTWIDNHCTGILQGVGELSPDGKTMTWKYSYRCPITKKPAVLRQVQQTNSDNSMTVEMFGVDPKSGKEYKCMRIELTKSSS